MKPNTFREAYKQDMDSVQLSDEQLSTLLAAIEVEEAVQTSTSQSTQEQTAARNTYAQAANGGYSPAVVTAPNLGKQPRRRFWQDWSMESKVTSAVLGATAALATVMLGFVVLTATLFGQVSTHSAQSLYEPLPFPTEGAVALAIADGDYENVYEVFSQIHEREEQRRLEMQRQRSSGGRGGGLLDFLSQDDEMPATDSMWRSEEFVESIPDESDVMAEGVPELRSRSTSADDPDFSDTNIQVQGVQEGDIIKTDGRYIYVLNNTTLTVMEANNGDPRVLSTLTFCNSAGFPVSHMATDLNPYFKIYLEGERLIALRARSADAISIYYTGVDIFDISNPADPEYLTSFGINGNLVSSRMIGDLLYLVCTSSVDNNRRDRGRPKTFVPSVTQNGKVTLVPPASIRIAPETPELRAEYTHIVAIDTSRGGRLASHAALLGGSDDLYMSRDNLFLLSAGMLRVPILGDNRFETVGNATTLTRVELSNGHIEIGSSRRLPGIVNNQFSLDEKDGVLRIITTFRRWEEPIGAAGSRGALSTNDDIALEEWGDDWVGGRLGDFTDTAVYTLDKQLEIIGMIDGFGIDEDLYSARFMGDIVYFVTFREIDPVYAVDLSDPANPRFLSELKIPAFSEYLHPWTKGLLFGFGRDACEITGIRGGLKLSMFDISNPKDVTREHYLILDEHMYSEASQNHRAILVSAERNLIAFPTDDSYLIYSYDMRRGFQMVEEVPLSRTRTDTARGLFIDDIFYVFILGERSAVETFRLPDFQLWGYLRF